MPHLQWHWRCPVRVSDLHITVEGYAGCDIPRAIAEMVALAWRLQIHVHADLNGVTVMARPGDDPQLLTEAWHKELLRPGNHYKVASVARSKNVSLQDTAERKPSRKMHDVDAEALRSAIEDDPLSSADSEKGKS